MTVSALEFVLRDFFRDVFLQHLWRRFLLVLYIDAGTEKSGMKRTVTAMMTSMPLTKQPRHIFVEYSASSQPPYRSVWSELTRNPSFHHRAGDILSSLIGHLC